MCGKHKCELLCNTISNIVVYSYYLGIYPLYGNRLLTALLGISAICSK